ncbi:MAG: glycosyltransferase family 9 protein [Aquificae bacterium]|nr:glycosyltransferase family 9 protein [Aquificota bacterium]
MKVVVWQSAFLGDLILATNFLDNLLRNLPSAKVLLVARPFAVELLRGFHPNLEVLPLEKTLRGTLEAVRAARGADLAFGLQRGARTSLALFMTGAKRRVGFDRAELSFLYTDRVPHRWGLHEVERNHQLLRAVGLRVYGDRLRLPVDADLLRKVRERFGLPPRFVLVSPGANFEPKRWAPENFAEVVRKLLKRGVGVVLSGSAADRRAAEEVLASLGSAEGVWNLTGKTSVREFVHLIAAAEAVLANDSAPVHAAEAVQTPVLTVYCATDPYYGFYPRSGVYLVPRNLDCHPCKPNPKVCKTGTYACRFSVSPQEVFDRLWDLLGKKRVAD